MNGLMDLGLMDLDETFCGGQLCLELKNFNRFIALLRGLWPLTTLVRMDR